MNKVISNIIFTLIGIAFLSTDIQATQYTNLKQALKNPKDVTILKLEIYDVAKKYQNKLFPVGIGKMVNLEKIEINTTTFTGFPSEISNCKKLKTIIITSNFSLPKEIASLELDSLIWKTSKEKISSIPDIIFSIKTLKYLSLEHQNISHVSDKINQLKNLEYLDFSKNQILHIPENFGQFPNLKYLYLQNNKITKVPEGLKKSGALMELNLNNNQIIELPPFAFDLPKLLKFSYLGNPITAENLIAIAEANTDKFHIYCSVDGEKNTKIEDVIKNPSNVIMLSIYGKNNADIFMQNAEKFYSLVYLEISGDVSFTYEIENLVNVGRLRQVVYNPLNGKIPAGFSKVTQIESFEVDLSEFSKIMPRVLFEMTQLKRLIFSAYNLESIPTAISKLKELESLSIEGYFKTIPESIGSLNKLKDLIIYSELLPKNSIDTPPISIYFLKNLERLMVNNTSWDKNDLKEFIKQHKQPISE